MLWMPTRLLLIILVQVCADSFIFLLVMSIKDHEQLVTNPENSWTRVIVKNTARYKHLITFWITGITIIHTKVEVDYTEYLGPQYEKPSTPSSIVTNHLKAGLTTDGYAEACIFGSGTVVGKIPFTGPGFIAVNIRKYWGAIEVSRD